MSKNKYMLSKNNNNNNITIIINYTLLPLKIKIINHLTKIILKSKFKNHYDFSYKTQIYNIKFVLIQSS